MNCLKKNTNDRNYYISARLNISLSTCFTNKYKMFMRITERGTFHFSLTGVWRTSPRGVLAWVLRQRGRHENVLFWSCAEFVTPGHVRQMISYQISAAGDWSVFYHDARGQSVQDAGYRRGRDGRRLSELLRVVPGQISITEKSVQSSVCGDWT